MAALAAPDDDGEPSTGMFAGKSFFVMQRVPCRSALIDDIRKHGGRVVKLEGSADHVIADDLRPDSPSGSKSWKFITESIKAGHLLNVEDYVITTRTGPERPAGSRVVTGKKTRNEYNEAESKELRDYVEARLKEDTILGPSGCVVYQEFERINPRHTWQSYQAHYKKNWLPTAEARAGITTRPQQVNLRRPADWITMMPNVSAATIAMKPEADTVSHSESEAPSDGPKRARTSFTREEDAAFLEYMQSKDDNQRSANAVYIEWANANSSHGWQSWRDHWVKVLSKRTQSDASRMSARIRNGFNEEDDLALWDYLVKLGFNAVSGCGVYSDFAKTHPRHTWQSWRDRYLKKLRYHPPAARREAFEASNNSQEEPQTGSAVHNAEQGPPADTDYPTFREVPALSPAAVETHSTPETRDLRMDRIAPTGNAAKAGALETPPVEGSPTLADDPTLSDEQNELLRAVLKRKPKDKDDVLWGFDEIGNLVANMPALSAKIDNDDVDPWEEWSKVMTVRTADDWKDLYYNHLIPERHMQVDKARRRKKATQAVTLEEKTTSSDQKRKAETPVPESSSKRQHVPDPGAGSSRSSQRAESAQLQSSHQRREWLFDRAEQRVRSQNSVSSTTSRRQTPPANRLTMANLARQTASLRGQPSHTERYIDQDDQYEPSQHQRLLEDNSQARDSLPSPAASPENDSLQLPPLPTTMPDSYDEDNEGVEESTPIPLPPDKTAPHVDTGMPTPAADVEESSPSRYMPSSRGIELDFDIPSPHASQQSTPRAAQRQAWSLKSSTATVRSGLRISTISSPPGSHITVPQDVDQGPPSSPPEIAGNAFATIEQESTQQSDQDVRMLDTQAILDADTQLPGFSLNNPEFDALSQPIPQSSPRQSSKTQRRQVIEAWRAGARASSQHDPDQILSSQQSQSQDQDTYFARWAEEGWSDGEILDAMYECSGRAALASSILAAKKSGGIFDEGANWRWTAEEDDIIRDGTDEAKSVLRQQHGVQQYDVRATFLSDMEED